MQSIEVAAAARARGPVLINVDVYCALVCLHLPSSSSGNVTIAYSNQPRPIVTCSVQQLQYTHRLRLARSSSSTSSSSSSAATRSSSSAARVSARASRRASRRRAAATSSARHHPVPHLPLSNTPCF